jgi:uncharacterized membrane protein YgdD (TMEM256/DUF423 family)
MDPAARGLLGGIKYMWTWWLAVGSTLSAVAIGIGAFGAHALKGKLSTDDAAIFETASKYLTTQSLGIILVSLCLSRLDSLPLKLAACSMTFGVLLFSGSLYALIWTGMRGLGAITPIGGVLLIVAWLLVAFAAISPHWV